MKVALQGEVASFHHAAAREWFGDDVAIVPADSFGEVFGLLNRREAEAAVVAVENSLYGSIHQVFDLLEAHRYPIVGEIHLAIHQQLAGRGTPGQITRIYSHPVALAQCEAYLDANFPNAERLEFHDTAGAAKYVAEENNPHYAAIASAQATELYGLPIIARDIEDNPANFTRFLVIRPGGQPPESADRTTLVLTTNHTPGALAKILTIIARAGVNLSNLQSRPIPGQPWKYRFYLVLDTAGDRLARIGKQLRPLTQEYVILGQYRRGD